MEKNNSKTLATGEGVYEYNFLIRTKNTDGDEYRLYPLTLAQNVDGLDQLISEAVAQKSQVQIIIWEDDD